MHFFSLLRYQLCIPCLLVSIHREEEIGFMQSEGLGKQRAASYQLEANTRKVLLQVQVSEAILSSLSLSLKIYLCTQMYRSGSEHRP